MTLEITEKKEEEKKPVELNDIKETLKVADEYAKLKEMNDKLEEEMKRTQEILKAQAQIGGKAFAGNYKPQQTEQEKAQEEAKGILSMYR